jgi:hypothetical protein
MTKEQAAAQMQADKNNVLSEGFYKFMTLPLSERLELLDKAFPKRKRKKVQP